MIPLTLTPDEYRTVTDDTEAKAFLVEYGALEKLLESRRPADLSGEWAATMYVPGHPTHWVAAVRYEGFARPSDNGYALHCIPKSKCSFDHFKSSLAVGLHALYPDGVQTADKGVVKPLQN